MNLSWDTADLIIRIVQILVVPAAVWVWRSFGQVQKEFGAVYKDIGALRERMSHAETRIDGAPDGKAITELSLSVERLRGDIQAVGERLTGIDRVVERVDKTVTRQETYLLNGAVK